MPSILPPLLQSRASVNRTSLGMRLRLDETSGTAAADDSGNGKNGTYTGTTSTTDVPNNIQLLDTRSRIFNGTTDLIDVGNNFDIASNFSLSVWIKTTNALIQAAVSKNPNSGSARYGLYLHDGGAPLQAFLITPNGTTASANSAVNFADGAWHHVCGVFNLTGGSTQLYGDGVLLTNFAFTADATTGTNAATFKVGRDLNGSVFAGTIDDVRFYSRPLSASEVALIASGEA